MGEQDRSLSQPISRGDAMGGHGGTIELGRRPVKHRMAAILNGGLTLSGSRGVLPGLSVALGAYVVLMSSDNDDAMQVHVQFSWLQK